MRRNIRPLLLTAVTSFWVMALVVGLRWLLVYDSTPGSSAAALAIWPGATSLERDLTCPTLVMTVHPRCACSRASVAELSRVVARAQRGLRVYVLAVVPEGTTDGWERTPLLSQAGEIPGVRVITDRGGIEAGRFGAQTSGQTSLYAPDGHLIFRGGITGSRGHEGDNAGKDAIVAAVAGDQPALSESPIFGCSLFAREPGLARASSRIGGAK